MDKAINTSLILNPLNWIIVGLILGFLGLLWMYASGGAPPPPFNLFTGRASAAPSATEAAAIDRARGLAGA